MRFSVLIFAILILTCCDVKSNNKDINGKILKDLNNKYQSTREFFGSEMVSHFPPKITVDNVTFTETLSPEFGALDFILIDKVKRSSLSKLIDKYKRESLAIYNPDDTCLLIVNRFARQNNFYNIKISKEEERVINRSCYSGLFPIPNFWHNDFTVDSTDCKLSGDFKIYILESKHGKFFDERYLTDGRFMPKNWKNGYSKGVAISEQKEVIIYWLLIW